MGWYCVCEKELKKNRLNKRFELEADLASGR
jgi:hypothetical protein